jgi:hypothetical protein
MSLNKRNVRVGDRMVRIGLHIATIDVNDETANPQRPCTPEKVGGNISFLMLTFSWLNWASMALLSIL